MNADMTVTARFNVGCPADAPASCLTGVGDWTRTLSPRSFDGGATVGGYYDSSLNVTWLANTDLSGAVPAISYGGNGPTIGGISGWRAPGVNGKTTGIPSVVGVVNDPNQFTYCNLGYCGFNPPNAPGANPPAGNQHELAHMYFVTLGNGGNGLVNTGPFANLQARTYWTGAAFSYSGSFAQYELAFSFATGWGSVEVFYPFFPGWPNPTHFVWLVHDGDVGSY